MAESPGKILSYQSVAAPIFDVPEPEDIGGNFVYNYFLADERVSTNTTSSLAAYNKHHKKHAREIHLSFTPLTAIIPPDAELSEIQLSDSQKERFLHHHRRKIIKETRFMNSMFMGVQLQDSTVTSRLLANIEANLRQKKIDVHALSPTETILKYTSTTTENVDGQALLESVDLDDGNEYISIDPATGKAFEVQKAGKINSLTFNSVLSQKFVGDMVSAAAKTPMGPAEVMFRGRTSRFIRQQKNARASKSSLAVRANNFQFSVRPPTYNPIDTNDVFLGGNTIMGYRVRKSIHRQSSRGRLRSRKRFVEDFFISNVQASSFIDREVLYGAKYEYAISVIYLVRFFGYKNRGCVAMDLLVESRESPSIIVDCVEAIPPEAPDGLEFYLLQNGKLCLEWEFPFNPTDDIKRFQVFRRKSIYEPFTLLTQLDFDDSIEQTPRTENIPEFSNTILDRPKMYYVDETWSIKDKYIYAITAVDAHDLGSGYSEQYNVGFDIFQAQLEVDWVAGKDAPKPYPNFTLIAPLTVDSIKDSNHSAVTCYFDPEYLKVINSSGEDMQHLAFSQVNPSYKLQLLHLNFQQSAVVDINVNE